MTVIEWNDWLIQKYVCWFLQGLIMGISSLDLSLSNGLLCSINDWESPSYFEAFVENSELILPTWIEATIIGTCIKKRYNHSLFMKLNQKSPQVHGLSSDYYDGPNSKLLVWGRQFWGLHQNDDYYLTTYYYTKRATLSQSDWENQGIYIIYICDFTVFRFRKILFVSFWQRGLFIISWYTLHISLSEELFID